MLANVLCPPVEGLISHSRLVWHGHTVKNSATAAFEQIQVNYPMTLTPGSAVAHTVYNGATRQIPGTQNSHDPIPLLAEDLELMRRAGNPSVGAAQEPK